VNGNAACGGANIFQMLLVILVVVVVLEHYDAAACVLLRATRLFLFSSRSDRISLVNAYSFFIQSWH